MKKMWRTVLVGLVVLGLTACSGVGLNAKQPIKCPACGYEFEAPMGG
jgi:hypothetical protein